MNNILLDEIELTDAELAGVYGADDDDDGENSQQGPKKEEVEHEHERFEREAPCVNIFIICGRKRHRHE